MKPTVYEIEEGNKLLPRFDLHEYLPCITLDADTGEVLMLGYMNKEALDRTIETGLATYYSRSRKKIWVKGEQSGFFQHVKDIFIDDDQDTLLLKVKVDGGASCHVGYRSCFYRKLKAGSKEELEFTEQNKVFDPKIVYKLSS